MLFVIMKDSNNLSVIIVICQKSFINMKIENSGHNTKLSIDLLI